jgi:hypothetical protein
VNETEAEKLKEKAHKLDHGKKKVRKKNERKWKILTHFFFSFSLPRLSDANSTKRLKKGHKCHK